MLGGSREQLSVSRPEGSTQSCPISPAKTDLHFWIWLWRRQTKQKKLATLKQTNKKPSHFENSNSLSAAVKTEICQTTHIIPIVIKMLISIKFKTKSFPHHSPPPFFKEITDHCKLCWSRLHSNFHLENCSRAPPSKKLPGGTKTHAAPPSQCRCCHLIHGIKSNPMIICSSCFSTSFCTWHFLKGKKCTKNSRWAN
jgi:hypothetical protein